MEVSYQRKFFGINKKSREKIISGYVLFCLIIGTLFPTTTNGSVPQEETITLSPNMIEGTWDQVWNIKYTNIDETGELEEFFDVNSSFPNVLLNYTRQELGLEEEEGPIIEESIEEIEIATSTLDELSTSTLSNTTTIQTPDADNLASTTTATTTPVSNTTTTTITQTPNLDNLTPTTTTSKKEEKDKEKNSTSTTTEKKKEDKKTEVIQPEDIIIEETTPATSTVEEIITPTTTETPSPETEPEPEQIDPEIIETDTSSTTTSTLSFLYKKFNWLIKLLSIENVWAQTEDVSPAPAPEPAPEPTPVIETPVEITPPPASEETVDIVTDETTPIGPTEEDADSLEAESTEESSEVIENQEEIFENIPEEEEEEKPVQPEINLMAKSFSIQTNGYYAPSTAIKNARIGISMANREAIGHKIIIYYKDDFSIGQTWKKLKTIKLKKPNSNFDNGGYFYFYLPKKIKRVQDLQTIEIKIEYEGFTREPWQPIVIDGLWLEAETDVPEVIEEILPEEDIIKLVSEKKDFNIEDDPQLIFSVDREKIWEKNNKGLVKNLQQKLKKKEKELEKIEISINTEAYLIDGEGQIINSIEPQIDTIEEDGLLVITMDKIQRKLKPGKYKLGIKLYQEDYVVEYEQDFTWGVLAINSNKGIYSQGEEVYLQMAALDETGHTLCDANLSLTVIDPDLNETIIPIETSGECGANNVIDTPDYFAHYTPAQTGKYTVKLTNNDISQEISDYFEVNNTIRAFDIERIGPTRIYPLADYEMVIKVNVNQNFTGEFKEIVPNNFIIKNTQITQLSGFFSSKPPAEFEIEANATETTLITNVNWKQDDIYEIKYTFDAPNISPYLFLLGPAQLSYIPQYKTIATTTIITTSTIVATSTLDLLQTLNPGIDFTDLMGVSFSYNEEIQIEKEIMIEPTVDDFTDIFTEYRKWQIASDEITKIEPDGDSVVNCSPTPSGANYSSIDDGTYYPNTPDTADYISCAVDISDSYTMSTTGNVATTTEIEVWSYYQNISAYDYFEIELWDTTESTQYGTTQQLTNATSDTWNNVTFSGLGLTQSQIDGIVVKYTNTQSGGTGSGSVLYSSYATIAFDPANPAPTVSSVVLNGGENIIPTAGTTTTIAVTALITDNYGYSDIQTPNAKIYRSGVTNGQFCTPDNNNCYQTSNCQLTNCGGNSCEAYCTFDIWFHADPTDADTPWASEYWRAWIEAGDSLFQIANGFSPVDTTDMQSVSGIMLEGSDISFGSLTPGEFTSTLTASTTIISNGNTSLDIIVYGTDMINTSSTSSTIPIGNIVFSTEMGSLYTSSTPLTTNPGIEIEFDIPKNINNFNFNSSTIWWGLKAPIPTLSGSYTGNIYYSATINETPW